MLEGAKRVTLKFKWDNHIILNKTVRVPYGWKKPDYALAPGETLKEFVPDYTLVPFIEKALESINNGTSLRDAANWLTVASGVPISHVGLKTLWNKVVVDPDSTDRKERLDTWRKPKTREEKKQRRFVERKAAAKRAITVNQKRLNKLTGVEESKDDDANSNYGGHVYSELPVEANVIFKPNDGPQTDFLAASELEVLYGGAAGG